MKLQHLKIKNYKRLYVTNITAVDYRPNKVIQVFSGLNGSGKSSLLEEIIPNTTDLNKKYDDNGFKELTYQHNGDTLQLSFSRDNKSYSFKVNGTELNTQHLKTTQDKFIEQYTGITKPIYELILSKTKFTEMSIQERKRWFTDIITTLDYGEALNLFNKVKIKIRDIKAYIKLTNSKLITVQDKLNKDHTKLKQSIREEIKFYEDKIDKLLNIKTNHLTINEVNFTLLESKNKELKNIRRKLNNRGFFKNSDFNDLNTKLIELRFERDNLLKENISIKKEVDEIDITDLEDDVTVTDLVNMNITLNVEIDNYCLKMQCNRDALLNKIDVYNRLRGELINLASNINENVITDFSIEKLTILENLRDNLENKIFLHNDKLRDVNITIESQNRVKDNDDVTCPSCNTVFKPNFSEELLNKSIKERNEISSILDKHIKENNIIKKEIVEIETKRNSIRKLKDFLFDANIIEFYNIVRNKTDDFKNTSGLIGFIDEFIMNLPRTSEVNNSFELIKNNSEKILILENVTVSKITEMKNKVNNLLNRRNVNINRINVINEEEHRIKDNLNLHFKLKQLFNEVENIYKLNIKNDEAFKTNRNNDYINKIVLLLKTEIVSLQDEYNNINRLESNKLELENELLHHKETLQANLKIEECLSPSTGIIGTSVAKTINVVLERMNDIISEIWTYDISILPCIVNSGGLNYKFPVMLSNDDKNILNDINEGSLGIKEVIDLAFKITVMEFLELTDYPLILDEFGTSMDVTHRNNSYDFITKLSKNYFSQIFIVTHYESLFGRFSDTDVIIIDDSNLSDSQDKNHNNVIKIEKDL